MDGPDSEGPVNDDTAGRPEDGPVEAGVREVVVPVSDEEYNALEEPADDEAAEADPEIDRMMLAKLASTAAAMIAEMGSAPVEAAGDTVAKAGPDFEPKVTWPHSAEDLLYQAASDLPTFPEKFNVLLLGLDRRDRRGILATGAEIPLEKLRKKRGNSDVIMVFQLDFTEGRIKVVSIPRDTKVYIPGYRGGRKINAAYAYGRERKAKQVVERFLDIEIHRTVVADWRSAKKCIEMFKKLGLDFKGYSEKEMFWYLRKRSFAGGDFTRIKRQQAFIRHAMGEYLRLMQQGRNAGGTMGLVRRQVMDMAMQQGLEVVETDLTHEEVKLLTYAFRNYDVSNMTMGRVRGRGVLEGQDQDHGGVYFYRAYRNHSFDDIIARLEAD